MAVKSSVGTTPVAHPQLLKPSSRPRTLRLIKLAGTALVVLQQRFEQVFFLSGERHRNQLFVRLRIELDVIVRKTRLATGIARILTLRVVMDQSQVMRKPIDEVDPRRITVLLDLGFRFRVGEQLCQPPHVGFAQRVVPVATFDLSVADVSREQVQVAANVRASRV